MSLYTGNEDSYECACYSQIWKTLKKISLYKIKFFQCQPLVYYLYAYTPNSFLLELHMERYLQFPVFLGICASFVTYANIISSISLMMNVSR